MFLIKEKRKRSIFCVDIIGNTIWLLNSKRSDKSNAEKLASM
jgi:hypothetical protein